MEAVSQIRIGVAGWSYKDWEGVFYPPAMSRKKIHALEYLAHFFDVVEINTSFYGHIKPELAKLWVRKVAGKSQFCFHSEAAPLVHAFAAGRDGADFSRIDQADG